MKRALTVALATLLCALGGLCLYQWKREAEFRAAIVDLSGKLHAETKTRTEAEQRILTLSAEISRLETLRADTETKYLAAMEELGPLQADWTARGVIIRALSEMAEKPATADQPSVNQNAVIEKQNQLLKSLASERDAAISKLNARTREFNALTEKYNKLIQGTR